MRTFLRPVDLPEKSAAIQRPKKSPTFYCILYNYYFWCWSKYLSPFSRLTVVVYGYPGPSFNKLLSTEKSSLAVTGYQPGYHVVYIVCDWFPRNFCVKPLKYIPTEKGVVFKMSFSKLEIECIQRVCNAQVCAHRLSLALKTIIKIVVSLKSL